MEKPSDRAIVWFRRDLRAHDHAALHHALRSAREVWCVFVFDTDLLTGLPARHRRVEFIHDSLVELDRDLAALGAGHGQEGARLFVAHGRSIKVVPDLAAALGAAAV